jgi:enoyl-CoA hydratase/carnithine racemase
MSSSIPDSVVTARREGEIWLVTIDNPPVNALGVAVRRGLKEAIEQANADAAVKAVLIVGVGKAFIAGADIREFGKPPQPPSLPEVCNLIEACAKPVVAAIHGPALGGGLEVAMSAHYRLALPAAKLGLPEVTLGLLPGAGGTQRAPRLMGARAAAEIMLSGKPLTADAAQAAGLVDKLAEGSDPAQAGLTYARELVAKQAPVRRARDLAIADKAAALAELDALQADTAKKSRGLFSPLKIVECVRNAVELPFDEGLARERALFLQCVDSPQRAGLVHAFFAERAAAKAPESKTDLPAGASGDSIGNRILAASRQAADWLVKNGASSRDIDEAVVAFGFAAGPYQADGAGNTKQGTAPATQDEIVRRYMAAMINEGAKVVHESIAPRPLDVDVALLSNHGFPRYRGGPMKYADMTGLDKVLADIREFAKDDAAFWRPSPLIERLVAEGKNFDSLNKG